MAEILSSAHRMGLPHFLQATQFPKCFSWGIWDVTWKSNGNLRAPCLAQVGIPVICAWASLYPATNVETISVPFRYFTNLTNLSALLPHPPLCLQSEILLGSKEAKPFPQSFAGGARQVMNCDSYVVDSMLQGVAVPQLKYWRVANLYLLLVRKPFSKGLSNKL